MKRLLRVLLALLAVAFAVVTFMPGAKSSGTSAETELAAEAEPTEEIHPAPVPEDIPEGAMYCWVSPDGLLLSEDELARSWSEEDSLKIYYPLDLESHKVYVFPDEYGLYRPDSPLTGAELYDALSVLAPHGADLPSILSECATDGEITLGKLISVLSFFESAPSRCYEFSDLGTEDAQYIAFCVAAENGLIDSGEDVAANAGQTLTRGEFVTFLNAVLGRTPADNISEELTGPILDISEDDALYATLAEAAIEHSHDGDIWTDSKPVEKAKPGFCYIYNRLCYVDDSGHLLKNAEVDGFAFDENGVYTCGNTELDEQIYLVLDKVVDDSMTKEEKLRAVYDHMMSEDYNYRKGNNYVIRYTGWTEEEAMKLFTTGKGNCYSYAAAFCELCRAIGYDAQTFSGFFGVEQQFHGWTEITIDEEQYICDPEMQMSYWRTWKEAIDMYMMTYEQAIKWNYVH